MIKAFEARVQAGQPLKVHALVALCDNEHQGIVPVPARLGNGDDPDNNLYWGALYGLRTHFKKSKGWKLISKTRHKKGPVIETVIFKGHFKKNTVFLVADAYRGRRIKEAMQDFLKYAAGTETREVKIEGRLRQFGAGAGLVAFVGHDGLMDMTLAKYPDWKKGSGRRDVVILACISKKFFSEAVVKAGAYPLVWSTGLMAAEAYTLRAAVDGWARADTATEIRKRAAQAYADYQKCAIKAARGLLVTGW
ncbi:MAG: hypothetical protein JRJ87_19015 [Deltaproteobacteria bacterium]|nr:hypothetical protein [Deltaproteobacteria bacterium]